MCFSAKASFIASGVLSLIGLLSIRTATKTTSKKIIPFSAIPFIFAIQQACEGIVWITITSKTPAPLLYNIGIYSFIFFAGIWWPLWGPITLYIIESNKTRQTLLLITLLAGVITATIYFFSLITQPVHAFIINNHIYYPTLSYPFPLNSSLTQLIESSLLYLYVIATVVPFFLSSIRFMWILGIVIGISGIISQQLYVTTGTSTWCFFAAIASCIIYIIVRSQKR